MLRPEGLAQYEALTTRAGRIDLPGRGLLELSGADRAAFLHNFCTNEVRNLPIGSANESFLTSPQAKVLAWLQVLALEDRLWVSLEPGLARSAHAWLERYIIGEAVQIKDLSDDFTQMLLCGPASLEALKAVGAGALEGLAVGQHGTAEIAGTEVRLLRNDWLRIPTWLLFVPADRCSSVKEALAVPTGDAEVFTALRLEAGLPQYGQDIDESNLPQEVNRTDQAISFTKGCYLGQETVARIRAYGHVNRLRVGLRLPAGETIAPGIKLQHSGKEAGHLTSVGWSPLLGGNLGMGYVRRGHDAVGTLLELAAPAAGTAEVIPFPRTAKPG